MLKRLIHLIPLSLITLLALMGFVSTVMAQRILLSADDYPPYTMMNPVNDLYGFDYEVSAAAFAAVGDRVEITFYPWARALKLVETKRVHGVISCTKNAEREHMSCSVM